MNMVTVIDVDTWMDWCASILIVLSTVVLIVMYFYSFITDTKFLDVDAGWESFGVLILMVFIAVFGSVAASVVLYGMYHIWPILVVLGGIFGVAWVARGVVRLQKSLASHKKDKEAHK